MRKKRNNGTWDEQFWANHDGFDHEMIESAISEAKKCRFFHADDFYNRAQTIFLKLLDEKYG